MASSALHPLGPWWDGSVTVPSTETPLCTVAKSQLLSCRPSPARLAQAKDIHVSILVFVSLNIFLGVSPLQGAGARLLFKWQVLHSTWTG